MLIFAIDPGPEKSAYVVYDSGGEEIFDAQIVENEKLLDQLDLLHISWNQNCDLAIEMIGHYGSGMPAGKSVFETCIWIGRFIQAALPLAAKMVMRQEVKMHLCGSMRAKDSNVRQALIDRFGAPGTKKKPGMTYGLKKDLWQAFALAVTFAEANQ